MPTDHEEPCGSSHRSFCLNGGICYVIPTIPSPFCRCIENYTGARCEEVFLPSSSIQTKSNLFAAFVALAVLLTLIVGALYCLCRKGHLQRASAVQYDVSLVETSSASAHRGFPWTTATVLHTLCYREYASRRLPCRQNLESKEQHDKTDDNSCPLTQSREAAQAWDPSGDRTCSAWPEVAHYQVHTPNDRMQKGAKSRPPISSLTFLRPGPSPTPTEPRKCAVFWKGPLLCKRQRTETEANWLLVLWGSGLSHSLQHRHLILQRSGPRTHMGDPEEAPGFSLTQPWSLGPFGE